MRGSRAVDPIYICLRKKETIHEEVPPLGPRACSCSCFHGADDRRNRRGSGAGKASSSSSPPPSSPPSLAPPPSSPPHEGREEGVGIADHQREDRPWLLVQGWSSPGMQCQARQGPGLLNSPNDCRPRIFGANPDTALTSFHERRYASRCCRPACCAGSGFREQGQVSRRRPRPISPGRIALRCRSRDRGSRFAFHETGLSAQSGHVRALP